MCNVRARIHRASPPSHPQLLNGEGRTSAEALMSVCASRQTHLAQPGHSREVGQLR